MHPWKKTLALAALFLLLIIPGALGSDQAPQEPLRDSLSPVTVVLTCDGQPGLDRTVTLTMKVTSEVAADHLRLLWPVPNGVTSAGPAQELLGAITAGETRTFQRDITFPQAGTFKVAAGVQIEFDSRHAIFGDADVLYFTIGEDGASSVSGEVARTSSPAERIAAPEVYFTPSADPNAGYWVTGRFMYEDKQVANTGSTPVITYTLVPARQILVEVKEDDGVIEGPSSADDHDCSTHTDDEGYFSCWVSDNEDIWGGKETYVEFTLSPQRSAIRCSPQLCVVIPGFLVD